MEIDKETTQAVFHRFTIMMFIAGLVSISVAACITYAVTNLLYTVSEAIVTKDHRKKRNTLIVVITLIVLIALLYIWIHSAPAVHMPASADPIVDDNPYKKTTQYFYTKRVTVYPSSTTVSESSSA